jgi:Protein of unknown function (DUF1580)
MSDANDPTAFPLTEAPGHFTTHPSKNTLRRWALHGVRGVRLRSWLVGGRRHTSDQAIEEFLGRLNGEEAEGK